MPRVEDPTCISSTDKLFFLKNPASCAVHKGRNDAVGAGYATRSEAGAAPPACADPKMINATPARQNPKSEYRNPKQYRKSKFQLRNPKPTVLENCDFFPFEIVSNFGFRVSNF